MLKEIGFDTSYKIPSTGEVEKLYEALKTCYEHYLEKTQWYSEDESPFEATVDYGVMISETDHTRWHTLEIVIPDKVDEYTLAVTAAQIINEYDFWGWDDTDPVGWKIEINNGFHYDRAVSSIKITLEDWAS